MLRYIAPINPKPDRVVNIVSQRLAPMLDYAIGRYLQADPPLVASSLKTMAGKAVGLSLTVPKVELFLLIKEDTIRVCADYQGPTDTQIRGSLFDLLKLGSDKNLGEDEERTIDLEIVGDVHLGQRLQRLFAEIEFDWEELLVPVIGDIGAHQLSEGVRATGNFAGRCIDSLTFSSGEYLREELKITPTPQELSYFIDKVEELRDAIERLDARLCRIERG